MSLRVHEPRNHVEELDDRARPAVRDQQRDGVRVPRARVDEMDRLAVDARAEVLKLVEPRLVRSPVVLVAPVLHQLAQIVDRTTVLPARAHDLVREPGLREPAAQVRKHRVVDADLEPLDRLAHRALRGRYRERQSISRDKRSMCARCPYGRLISSRWPARALSSRSPTPRRM